MEIYIFVILKTFGHDCTAGSKDPVNGKTGAGICIPEFDVNLCKGLTNDLSVWSTEMVAVIVGLQWIEDVQPSRVVICSDSESLLCSLRSGKSEREDLGVEIMMLFLWLQRYGIEILFCEIPSHTGVYVNDLVDIIS